MLGYQSSLAKVPRPLPSFGHRRGKKLSVALGFAKAGADVVAVSRRGAEVEKTAAEIRALGRQTVEATADVRSRSDIQHVADLMVRRPEGLLAARVYDSKQA